MTSYIADREIYTEVLLKSLPKARKFLWIGTADIKDLYIDHNNRMMPFLAVLDKMLQHRIAIRLIHAKEPGKRFRKDFDKYPLLWKNMERICCPRVHFKMIIIDGNWAYIGSANLTGAGMGAKNTDRRNFENGITTDEPKLINPAMNQFDQVWMGAKCKTCQRKNYCIDKIDKV